MMLLLVVCVSTAGAQEPVSRQELEAIKQEMQEMKALVGELKDIIQQQQGVIVDLKKDVHETGQAIAHNDDDDDDGDGHGSADNDHGFEEILGTIKPRVSVTGDFLANVGDDTNMGHETDRFDLRGVDLTFVGEIDDRAEAVFNFSYHDDDVSLEEGYLDVWDILPCKTDLLLGSVSHGVSATLVEGAFFLKTDGATTIASKLYKDGAQTFTANVGVAQTTTDLVFEMYWDGTTLSFYLDGVFVTSAKDGLPDGDLTLSLNVKAGSAAARTASIAWARSIFIG
jgi:hypothetical protein